MKYHDWVALFGIVCLTVSMIMTNIEVQKLQRQARSDRAVVNAALVAMDRATAIMQRANGKLEGVVGDTAQHKAAPECNIETIGKTIFNLDEESPCVCAWHAKTNTWHWLLYPPNSATPTDCYWMDLQRANGRLEGMMGEP